MSDLGLNTLNVCLCRNLLLTAIMDLFVLYVFLVRGNENNGV